MTGSTSCSSPAATWCWMKAPFRSTRGNITKAVQFVEGQRGGGGTQLLPALQKALAMPQRPGVCRSIVLITDGYVNVEKEAFELVRNQVGKANLFVFGVGSSVNRFLVEGLARAGQGEAQVVLNPREASAKALAFRRYISNPILKNITVQTEGFAAGDLEPLRLPDLFSRRPLMLVGKYTGEAKGRIVLRGESAAGAMKMEIEVGGVKASPQNSALPRLWARERITRLADLNQLSQDDERRQEVLNLGLKYGLLTDYTSFVAIDSQARAEGGKPVTVKQPLPLPSGVPNSAVGGGNLMASRRSIGAYQPALAPPPSPLAAVLAGPSMMECLDAVPDRGGAPVEMPVVREQKAERQEWLPVLPSEPGVPGQISLQVLHKITSCQNVSPDAALQHLLDESLACYRKWGPKHGGLRGEIVLELAIGPDGKLTAATVIRSDLSGAEATRQKLMECLANMGQTSEQPMAAAVCASATVKLVLS